MQKDMPTRKKTPLSSLCKKVSFQVPTSWGELSQQQLHYVLNLLWLYAEQPHGMAAVKMWALKYFCGFNVVRHTDAGWLCELTDTRQLFILRDDLLPSMEEQVSWLDHPEEMTIRIEQIGEFKAVDMWLRQFEFGYYLALENYYQTYLQTHDERLLGKMLYRLYQVPADKEFVLSTYQPLSVFLWYTAIKKRLAETFTHFLKVAGDDAQGLGTRQTQFEMMQAQIRLLTKGDVTKYQQVMDADTWQALAELDALSKESEEFKRKYGNKHVRR